MTTESISVAVAQTAIPLILSYLVWGLKKEIKSQKEIILAQRDTINLIKEKSSEILDLKDIHKRFSEDIYQQTQIYKKIMDDQVERLRNEAEENTRKLKEYRGMN